MGQIKWSLHYEFCTAAMFKHFFALYLVSKADNLFLKCIVEGEGKQWVSTDLEYSMEVKKYKIGGAFAYLYFCF